MDVRHPDDADLPAVLALVQAFDRSVIGDTDWTEAELKGDWERLDPDRDLWLVELDGRIAGYAALFDRGAGRLVGDGYVHPEARGRGVGGTLLRLTQRRARALAAAAARPERVVLQNATLLGDDGDGARDLYEAHGYAAVRHFWRMAIDLEAEPVVPSPPDGTVIDGYEHEQDARDVHAAIQEAFRDHWQHQYVPWEEWERERLGREDADPSLWFVARDRDEAVGAVLASRNRGGGWGAVDVLGVRRPWRGRGVGDALLRTAFRALWWRGERRITLGVDAESPTGATRLYERAGMRIFWRAVVWEKELRGGA